MAKKKVECMMCGTIIKTKVHWEGWNAMCDPKCFEHFLHESNGEIEKNCKFCKKENNE